MATDIKNNAAGDTGAAQNGKITVKGSKSNAQYQNPPLGIQTYTISLFDTEYATLSDRFDDPRYYKGDAPT